MLSLGASHVKHPRTQRQRLSELPSLDFLFCSYLLICSCHSFGWSAVQTEWLNALKMGENWPGACQWLVPSLLTSRMFTRTQALPCLQVEADWQRRPVVSRESPGCSQVPSAIKSLPAPCGFALSKGFTLSESQFSCPQNREMNTVLASLLERLTDSVCKRPI